MRIVSTPKAPCCGDGSPWRYKVDSLGGSLTSFKIVRSTSGRSRGRLAITPFPQKCN